MNKQSEQKNIFIIQTPYQLSVARDVALYEDGRSVIFIIETSEKSIPSYADIYIRDLTERGYIVSIHLLEFIRPQSFGFRVHCASLRNIQTMRRILKGSECNIFISDISWPINNYIFFKYGGIHNISLFEEGIGSYAAFRRGFRSQLRGGLRYILGVARVGPYFRMYAGELMGGGRGKIQCQYLYNPSLSKIAGRKERIVRVPLRGRRLTIPSQSVVVLETSYPNTKVARLCADSIHYAILYINKDLQFPVYVKGHHISGQHSVFDYIDMPHSVISSASPIEDFEIGDDVYIISYFSSALANLKNMHGPNINCISVDLTRSGKYMGITREAIEKLSLVFHKLGVVMLNSPDT